MAAYNITADAGSFTYITRAIRLIDGSLYGFQTINANGQTGIHSTETAVRYVGVAYFNQNFTGNISVPNFDSDRGAYILTPYVYKINVDTQSRASDTATGFFNIFYATDVAYDGTWKTSQRPVTSWNNTTKIFSVTGASTRADYKVMFLNYK